MNRLTLMLLIILLFLGLTRQVSAEKVAGNSAIVTYNVSMQERENTLFVKKLAIKKVINRYSAPLSDSADSFMKTCSSYKLDCYLLPSISGLESTFGKFIYPDSFNPFGWGRGYIMFKSWDDGIEKVGKGLHYNYISKGANSIEHIASLYSESPTWAPRIRRFMAEFQAEEDKLRLYLSENTVKL